MKTTKTRSTLTAIALATTVLAASWGSAVPQTQVHAATLAAPVTAHTFALPGNIVGGTLRLTSQKRYGDGAITYMFQTGRPAGHADAAMSYLVHTTPSLAGTIAYNSAIKSAFAAPMLEGDVSPVGSGAAWGYIETGDSGCRTTMGGPLGHVTMIVTTMTTNTDNCSWAADYTEKIAIALLHRLPPSAY